MWYKDFDEKLQIYNSSMPPTLEEFEKWYFWHLAPHPFQLTKYADVTVNFGKPMLILFRNEGQKDDDFAAEFELAAQENFRLQKTPMYFAYTSLDDDYSESLAKHFDFERYQLPALRLSHQNYKFKPHFNTVNTT